MRPCSICRRIAKIPVGRDNYASNLVADSATARLTKRVSAPINLVLDTNIVLDWLVFDDPATRLLRDALHDGRVVVLTSPTAADELQRVLAYPHLKLDTARQTEILLAYRASTTLAGVSSESLLPPGFPRCRDHDDDHFVALCLHTKATALVSRDKQVLKLKSRAAKFNVRIVDVEEMNSLLSAQTT